MRSISLKRSLYSPTLRRDVVETVSAHMDCCGWLYLPKRSSCRGCYRAVLSRSAVDLAGFEQGKGLSGYGFA
jgi:hypothetical protein